ncbi:hypothetical protein [Burkholderia aenigmatica]|nr:hypothetical protein [Burkholderia aenigmatica]MDN7875059.1 hypothetical protein [Burkholderia aenigmatica]
MGHLAQDRSQFVDVNQFDPLNEPWGIPTEDFGVSGAMRLEVILAF